MSEQLKAHSFSLKKSLSSDLVDGDSLISHSFWSITNVKSNVIVLNVQLTLFISDESNSASDHSELLALLPTNLDGGDTGYLNQAATELTAAMEREKDGEFSCAIRGYRAAVDILITGVQGERVHEGTEEDGLAVRGGGMLFTILHV